MIMSIQPQAEPDDSKIQMIVRAYSDPIELDLGSSFLFLRVFFTRTGIHFAGKRSRKGGTADSPEPRNFAEGSGVLHQG
jgi:hypothetical protein